VPFEHRNDAEIGWLADRGATLGQKDDMWFEYLMTRKADIIVKQSHRR